VSLIADSLKKASEEWKPDRCKSADHILNRPLPLKYSNFRSHWIMRNITFASGLLVATVLLGFLARGEPSGARLAQMQVPSMPEVKFPAATQPPTIKKITVPAVASSLGGTAPSAGETGAANTKSVPVVESASKRDKIAALEIEVAAQSEGTPRKETAQVKNKSAIKYQEAVLGKTVTVKDEPVVQPQETHPAPVEPTRVSRVSVASLPKGGGAENIPGPPSEGKVRVNVQVGVAVPENKKPLAEEDLFHDSEYYFNLAVYYHQKKNYLKALELYDKALQLDPADARPYNNRSLIHQKLGNKDQAVEGFLKAIRLDPEYGKPYNNMGLVYYHEGNYSGAAANFEKAIELGENHMESYNNLAIVYKNLNRLKEAKALYKKILTRVPSHAEASYNLALLLEDEGNIDSAVQFYRRFVKMGAISHPSLASKVRNRLQALE